MGKTLVVAEKPSVGRDIAGALPGTFKASSDKSHLTGDDYVITWTVGHLVGLADPEVYDPKLKKWRYADLPIVPAKFKLVPNDAKAEKQLKSIHRLMRDDEIDVIVNACDAGREGELIFAYTYETSKSKKPVRRLWLSSMTRKAIQEAFQRLRDGDEMKDLESAARARSEADWIVGMNATRAATLRLRSAFDGAVSLGRVQTPTLALVVRREVEIRAFVPEPYWLGEARVGGPRVRRGPELAGRGALRRREGRLPRPLQGRQAPEGSRRGREDRRRDARQAGHDHQAREEGGARAAEPPLRPDDAAAPREHAVRVLGAPHAVGRAGAVRASQGDHVSAHQLQVPLRRPRARDQADRGVRRAERA